MMVPGEMEQRLAPNDVQEDVVWRAASDTAPGGVVTRRSQWRSRAAMALHEL